VGSVVEVAAGCVAAAAEDAEGAVVAVSAAWLEVVGGEVGGVVSVPVPAGAPEADGVDPVLDCCGAALVLGVGGPVEAVAGAA
jgi:hypothetical protein